MSGLQTLSFIKEYRTVFINYPAEHQATTIIYNTEWVQRLDCIYRARITQKHSSYLAP